MKYLYLTDQYSQQRQREKKVWVYPVLMAMEASKRIRDGHTVHWNKGEGRYDELVTKPQGLDFLSLPRPDRVLTDAFNPKYQLYGNYMHHPATHFQVADGCWWGKCKFCVECGRKYRIRNVSDVLLEIDVCSMLGFKEMFDDSGTFPDGEWLIDFCKHKKGNMVLGCNMRIDGKVDFKQMKRSGFRMVLFGIESANQSTLDRINKGTYAKDIIPVLKKASDAGLDTHGAFMFRYPWESEAEDAKTLELCHYLLRKGYLRTAQASTYDTPDVCRQNGKSTPSVYGVARFPGFWYHQIRWALRSPADFKYLLKSIRKGIGW